MKRAARNLAGKGADYGIRLELPNRMKTDMAALQSVSYEIRQKFPEARRNVLFDDDKMALVLDFRTLEGRPWRRMTAVQAKERKKSRKSDGKLGLEAGEIDEILDQAPRSSGDDGNDAQP